MFELLRNRDFDIQMLHHAEAILRHDVPGAVEDIESVLGDLIIPIEELIGGGGGEGQATQRIRHALNDDRNWDKHCFEIRRIVDGKEKESISHEIDHVKQFGEWTVALEIEWNNKDPFFDRDLENFKRLHADGVISLGAIITRGKSLQDAMRTLIAGFAEKNEIVDLDRLREYYSPTSRQEAIIGRAVKRLNSFSEGWAHAFVADKFGEATTHWRKLQDRVQRGVGNPCPLLLIGLPSSIVEA